MQHCEIAIVGGGLTGLSLVLRLHRAGRDVQVFEARDRLGGRIKTVDGFDMGPSWFWPGQPRMAALVRDLGLAVYDQYASGALSYETETGEVLRNVGYSSMQGSLRVRGGMGALVEGLAGGLPAEVLHLGHRVTEVAQSGEIAFDNGAQWTADQIILALPPRVAAELAFAPAIDAAQRDAWRAVPTWMAGHAKFVAVYETPFWRKAGLSGDAMSRLGPLAEIHDASLPDGRGALFGFVGVPVAARQGQTDALVAASLAQLARVFGEAAATPVATHLDDWAVAPETATALDRQPLTHHPGYGLPDHVTRVWDGKVVLCSTETAAQMGGYLEGALSAADGLVEWVFRGVG